MVQRTQDRPRGGIAAILLASVFFTGMGVATKLAVPRSSTWDVVFWRSMTITLIAFSMMLVRRTPLRPGAPRLLLGRCVTGFSAMCCFFYALGQIPLASATALLYTSPILTVLLSTRVTGEAPPRGVLPLTLVAFGGCVAVVAPTELAVDIAALAALAAGVLASLAYLSLRNLRHADPPDRIVFYFALFSVLMSAPFRTGGAEEPLRLYGLFLAVGVTAAGGQLLSTLAYRWERANIIGPFSYATLLFSYVVGLLAFDETLSLRATVGIGAILLAGVGLSARARSQATPAAHTEAAPVETERAVP